MPHSVNMRRFHPDVTPNAILVERCPSKQVIAPMVAATGQDAAELSLLAGSLEKPHARNGPDILVKAFALIRDDYPWAQADCRRRDGLQALQELAGPVRQSLACESGGHTP